MDGEGVGEEVVGPAGGGDPGGVMVTPGIGPPEEGMGTTETTVPMMPPGGWMAPSGVPGGTSMVIVTVPVGPLTVTVLS